MTTATTERQAPVALLAVVQHINDHDLGAPLSIFPPINGAPYFCLTVVSTSLTAWLESGFVPDRLEREEKPGRIAGRVWERLQYDGTLQPHGIRVQLVTRRPLADQAPVLHLAEVTA